MSKTSFPCLELVDISHEQARKFCKQYWDALGFDYDPERPTLLWAIERNLNELQADLEAHGVKVAKSKITFDSNAQTKDEKEIELNDLLDKLQNGINGLLFDADRKTILEIAKKYLDKKDWGSIISRIEELI